MWTAKFVSIVTSASTRGNSLVLDSLHFSGLRYKQSKFDFDRSIKKGTLTWRAKYVIVCISAAARGHSLDRYT